MSDNMIQTVGLTKCYGDKTAVNQLNLSIRKGEVFGLLGPNGAGKTTTTLMLLGLTEPTEGFAVIGGKDCTRDPIGVKRLVGYLPDNVGFYGDMTGRENLYFTGKLNGLADEVIRKRTEELLERVGMTEAADYKTKTYSRGMKQRLGIAQAVMENPDILILDEPTAGLDPKERVRFRNIISDFAKNKIVILSTHIVSDVSYIADIILMMKQGKIFLQGPMATITDSIRDKVWEIQVDEREADKYSRNLRVVNLHHEGNQVHLRIVEDSAPTPDARSVEPSLEDLFLYHFSEDMQSERSGNDEIFG